MTARWAVLAKVEAVRAICEKAEVAALKEKTDALVQNSMKLGEIMYKEAQEKAEKEKKDSESKTGEKKSQSQKAKKSKKDEKVVDADFEDVTEKKDQNDDNKEKSA